MKVVSHESRKNKGDCRKVTWRQCQKNITDYRRMMSKFQIIYGQNLHTQNQMDVPLKKCWLMENRGLGMYRNKICAENETKNTPHTPK